ncbi:hypothetical protein Tco_0907302 [Tanacetum coccineum]|uniref:Uncharacterized protein n=1 Tax=Tanacetum coccineum TaxID=301880 RepID=A0ABQ5CKV8_9ASTR
MAIPRTDIELTTVIQAAVQAMLSQIREEFWDGVGPSNGSGENPPPVTIHTWLECFNQQNPQPSHVHTVHRRVSSCCQKLLQVWPDWPPLTRKPDTSSHVFAITQNQTTNISEELPGISSIRDVEYDIELLPEQSLLQKLLIAYLQLSGHVVLAEGITMDPAKVEAVTKWPRPTSETEARSFLGISWSLSRSSEDRATTRFSHDTDDSYSAASCLFIHDLYLSLLYYFIRSLSNCAQPYFFSCFLRQMAIPRTDIELTTVIQAAVQAMLSQIREEFWDGVGPSNGSGENPPPVTIHTWLECFNQQNPQPSHVHTVHRRVSSCCQKLLQVWPDWPPPTRKPDTSSRVFAITQNQTTNISEELPGISSIRDVEYDIELLPEQSLLQKLLIAYPQVVEGFSRLALPLTKLTRKDEKLYGSKSERRSLKNEIVQLHGTPSAIVSDKDPRFTFRILETHTRQEGYTNKLSRPLKLSAKLSCFLESIAYEWRQTSHKYHSFHDVSYPHDQIHEDLSHLNEPEAILNCQDRVLGDGILGKRDVLRMRATLRLTLLYGLPHIHEEFRDGIGPSNGSGENPPPVTIHTRFERFNKQNPHSFDNAAAPKDAENRISQLEEILMFSRQGWLCISLKATS